MPDNISVIGMDDVSLANILTPELTMIKQPFKEMTEKAVAMIIMQKENMVPKTKHRMVEEPTDEELLPEILEIFKPIHNPELFINLPRRHEVTKTWSNGVME